MDAASAITITTEYEDNIQYYAAATDARQMFSSAFAIR